MMIPKHQNSRGEDCFGCGCENSEAPHNVGGIVVVGCCALRHTHGTFKFDEETGEVTQWPVCCAEHVHTGPEEPDGVCPAHRPTKPEHVVTLTVTGPILPLDEPVHRLLVAEVTPGRSDDPVVQARLVSGQRVALPASLFPRHPKFGVPALPVPRAGAFHRFGLALGMVQPPPYEIEVRGYNLLRSGALMPTVGRQFAQKRIDALFGRIQRAAFNDVFTPEDRARLDRTEGRAMASIEVTKERLWGVSLTADMDAGRIDISVTAKAVIRNPHNPERGGYEFHHVAPLDREVGVVTPAIGGTARLELVA